MLFCPQLATPAYARSIALGSDQPYLDYLPLVLHHYGRAAQLGAAHVLQAVPRLLTLLFEFGADLRASPQPSTKERTIMTKVCAVPGS